MTPTGQLLLRNLARLHSGTKLLWINPPADESWQAVEDSIGRIFIISQDLISCNYLLDSGANTRFQDFPDLEEKFDHVILSLPRGKPRLEMLLNFAGYVLNTDGRIWLLGENKAGIRSAFSRLEERYSQVSKVDSARHCCLFEAKHPRTSVDFNPADYATSWRLDKNYGSLHICSLPGVFAEGRLDAGTEMLLETLPSLAPFGSVLDFGCGCGIISALMAKLDPDACITMTDIDIFALNAAGKTMEANGFQAKILPGDGLGALTQKFDLIVSNPPFHHGYKTDMGLSMRLLDPVRNFLSKKGSLVMVVNRHIPYRKWLDEKFGCHEVLRKDSRYQVLRATQIS